MVLDLASRKCDFKNAETLRFEIAPPKKAAIFYFSKFGPTRLASAVSKAFNCDLEFAISKHSGLQLHSAIFLQFCCGTCGKSAIFNSRLDNRAILWDAKVLKMARFLNFEKLAFRCLFALVPVWVSLYHHTKGVSIRNSVAQCSATPATVAATPPCSATPFQTPKFRCDTSRHRGGGGATPKFLGGVARRRCYTSKTL